MAAPVRIMRACSICQKHDLFNRILAHNVMITRVSHAARCLSRTYVLENSLGFSHPAKGYLRAIIEEVLRLTTPVTSFVYPRSFGN